MKLFKYNRISVFAEAGCTVWHYAGLLVSMVMTLIVGLIFMLCWGLARRQMWFAVALVLIFFLSDMDSLRAAENALVISGTEDISNQSYNTSSNNHPAISGSTSGGANGVVTGSNVTVTTSGTNSHAIQIYGDIKITLDNSTLNTSGVNAAGVYCSGTGTQVTLNDTSITTTGTDAYAINANKGAMVTINGGMITTADASGYSSHAIYGQGAGTVISGSGITIQTAGMAVDAETGVKLDLTDCTITTTGTTRIAYAINASGAEVTLNRMNASTEADESYAVNAANNAQVTINGGIYSTQGKFSDGVYVNSSTAHLSHLEIDTTGQEADGINANSNSSVFVDQVDINTQGVSSYGIWGVGTTLVGTDVQVSTTGDQAHGICIQGGTASFEGLTISTSGSGAYGLYTEQNITAKQVNITTTGVSGVGVAVFRLGVATLDSGFIQTSGNAADGLYAGGSSRIDASNFTVRTSGTNAIAAYTSGGTLGLQDGSYSTSGVDAYGLMAKKGVISGSSILVNSEQSYGVVMTDSSTVTMSNSQITGKGAGFYLNAGTSAPGVNTVEVNGGSVSAVNGNAFQVDSGSANIMVKDAVISGSNILAIDGTDSVRFTAEDSILEGAFSGNDYAGASTVLVGGQWTVTGDSLVNEIDNTALIYQNSGAYHTVTVTENYTGNSVLAMNADVAAGTGDQLVVNGTATGRAIRLTLNGANPNGTEGPLLMVSTGTTVGSFSGAADKGMYRYGIVNGATYGEDPDNWYLGNMGAIPTPPSPTASTILGMVAGQSLQWFTQLDNLNKRMGELRLAMDQGKVQGNVWIRSYGSEVNVGAEATGRAFDSYLYGFDIGVDKAWQIDAQNTLVFGVFGGYGEADQDFNINGSDGESDSIYGGLYGTWLHRDGWYADMVAKVQHFDNSFDVWDDSYNHSSGDYEDWGAGVSLEFGKQIKLNDGWFVEPQAQVNYVHLFNNGFGTQGDNAFMVDNSDADILQFRGGVSFGRTIHLNGQSGILQPYVKVSGIEEISSGDEVSADGDTWRPNMDGLSVEVDAGLVWQIDNLNQLHVAYQAAFGDKYDQPWGINAGFRHRF